MYQEQLLSEMKSYIETHLGEEITLKNLSDSLCYSQEYCSRLFKEMTGMNIFEYIRQYRLSRAARVLREGGGKILDIALAMGFKSHEGFSRAFSSQFGLSPIEFRKKRPDIDLFIPWKVRIRPGYLKEKEMETMVVFTQIINRPKRKLLVARAKKATEYFEYCEEMGCDIFGRLENIKGALNEPMGMWMPPSLRPEGTSLYTQGVEVPLDYSGPIPEDLDVIELPEIQYMVFQSPPYQENDETMMRVITTVKDAIEKYDPLIYGYQWAENEAPRYQLAPIGERGYIEALPVKAISKD